MSKNKGYVSIWRDIQEHDLWTSESFSRGQAWVDLLLMANHEEKTFILGNEVIKAEVGSVITSELKLMNKWKWSKEKLRNFLKLLEKLEMIERRADRKKTYILICNYSEYQTTIQTTSSKVITRDKEESQTTTQTTNRPQTDHRQTTDRTQTITMNNYSITTNNNKKTVSQHRYGEYNNVLLSDEELEKLKKEYPEQYLEMIEKLSGYMKSKGKHYKSHYATIRIWIKNNENDKKNRSNNNESGEKGKVFNVEDFI